MYQTSAEWENRIYEDVENKIEIKLGNVTINEDDILELSMDCLLNDENVLSVGNTRAKGIDLLIYKRDYPQTPELSLRAGIKVIDKFEMIPMGTFIIDTWELEDDNTIRIKGSDYMSKFNFRYDASSLVPCTLDVILKDICKKAKVELAGNTANLTTTINVYDNTISAREYISYIAEQAGMNAFIGRDNKLYLKEFYKDTANVNIEYFGEFKFSDTAEISRVLYEDAIRKYEAGNNNKSTLYLNSANPYITDQKQVDNILALTQNKSVNGFSGKTIIDPAIDIGDKIIVDGKSTIFQGNLEFLGRWTATIENTIDTKARQENVTKITNAEKSKILKTEINENTQQITLLNKQINEIEGTQEVTQSINGVKEATFEADGGKLEQARFSGEAEQNTTKGYNLLNIKLPIPDKLKYLITQINNSTIMLNGTLESATFWQFANNLSFQKGKTYSFSSRKLINSSYYIGAFGNGIIGNRIKTFDEDITNGILSIVLQPGKYDNFKIELVIAESDKAEPYEPYTGGIPSPNPDYPQNINVVDKINYSVTGKNLFDKSEIKDGNFNRMQHIYIKLKSNTNYTLSTNALANYNNAEGSAHIFIKSGYYEGTSWSSKTEGAWEKQSRTKISDENGYITIGYRKASNIPSLQDYWYQIEEGTKATEYVPYQNFTQEILLPNGEFLAKIGDVSDELKEDGTIIKRIGKLELSGNENWQKRQNTKNTFQISLGQTIGKTVAGICNYFENYGAKEIDKKNGFYSRVAANLIITFLEVDTVEQFKNWLKTKKSEGKPVIVYYESATERISKLTTDELDKLQNLQVLKNENNLTSNAFTYGNYTLTVPALFTLQEKLTQIDLNQDNISLLAKKTTTVEKQAEDNSKVINETKTQLGEIRVNQENIQLEVRDITDNGVSKVKNTLVNIDQEGMRVSKAGEEINTLISNTGVYVNDHSRNMLTTDKNGVITENLLVRTYANIGYHRFEKFIENGEKRTGCFYIG